MTSQGTNQQSSTAGESGLDTCDIRCRYHKSQLLVSSEVRDRIDRADGSFETLHNLEVVCVIIYDRLRHAAVTLRCWLTRHLPRFHHSILRSGMRRTVWSYTQFERHAHSTADDPWEDNTSYDSPLNDNQTPTGPARTLRMTIPTRPFLKPPSLPPPVKRSTLELLQKPVNFVPTIRSHFRDNMQETYNSISDIADGEKFIPNAAQKELEVSDEEIRSRYLLDHPDNETLSYMEEHAALVKIKEAAVSRQIQGASESA
ncbi:hypothetical protein FPOA_12400 [Fusarium poae]|uniref:Uncharacterized protein n=1 Tax=Fusarium poae TaxID=36050 RepID=A0A1B8A5W8_FUSPO|nr:hypothetical protein FPOA_13364 [Fusarium poae]OBS15878.1 hypothetical protein FPOA_13359 [Fusarium poae]OBS17057.1 hypothetical protein FPOA_12406 [Fusarium poae]OBS17068.1 hypothetical protein FPOA_12400 [Fusarium poae]